MPLKERRCDFSSDSSGRGGRLVDGGGLGAVVGSLNARWATELRNDDLDGGRTISDGLEVSWGSWAGAGGRATVGGGRGGGIEAL